MDLIDLIESHRFLGPEFLTWLWYRSEMHDGMMPLGGRKACELAIDDKITLEADMVETEQSVLKGGAPAVTPEAREALRQGKVPTQARIRIHHDGLEYYFTLKAAALQLSGVKVPTILTKEDDDKFYERMNYLEVVENVVDHFYGEFMGVRLSPKWGEVTELMRAWVRSDDVPPADAYTSLVAGIPVLARDSSAAIAAADGPSDSDDSAGT
jgi:hypothetical protein